MNLNKVQLIGRLTRDPELKSLPTGVPLCTFSIATSRVWFDQNKVKQEATEFTNCVAWNKTGENIAQYVKKGNLLYVEGRLETQTWDDKTTGEKRSRTQVIVDHCQFAPKSANPHGDGNDGAHEDLALNRKPKVEGKGYTGDVQSPIDYGETTINIDDIPF